MGKEYQFFLNEVQGDTNEYIANKKQNEGLKKYILHEEDELKNVPILGNYLITTRFKNVFRGNIELAYFIIDKKGSVIAMLYPVAAV